jgi:hypothetical protein
MHLLIWMLIKVDNLACVTLTETSVKLQYGKILCLTDASIKCPYRHSEEYRFGKRDTHETIEDFYDTEKLGTSINSHRPAQHSNVYI